MSRVLTALPHVVDAETRAAVAGKVNAGLDWINNVKARRFAFAEEFGIVGQDLSLDRPDWVDQKVAIQAAIDWSAANRAPVYFASGRFCHNGPLQIKSDMCIVGPDGGQTSCVFQQMDQTYPDCWEIPFAKRLSQGGDGVGVVTLMNVAIDGGWDLKKSANTGNNWDFSCRPFSVASVTQANPAVFSVTGHTFFNGVRVRVTNAKTSPTSATGQGINVINDRSLIVRNVAGDTFTLEDENGAAIDGSLWNAYNTSNKADIHAYAQLGFDLDSPANGSSSNNAGGQSDPHNMLFNVRIKGIAGTGLRSANRGEMVVKNLWVSSCAYAGVDWQSFDDWIDTATVSVCGRSGWIQGGGNCRMSNVKVWFIGYASQVGEEYGVGFEVQGSNTSNITATNITVQDTWGDAYVLSGQCNYFLLGADNTGSLKQEFNLGPALPNGYKPNILNLSCKNTLIQIQAGQRTTSLGVKATLCKLASAASGNRVMVAGGQTNTGFVGWDESAAINQTSGNVNAKAYNHISTTAGLLLLGTVTAAQLGDAAHAINSKYHKSRGVEFIQAEPSGVTRKVIAHGPLTTDKWVDALGADLYTPA